MPDIVPTEIKTTAELPVYFLMFQDDLTYALGWIEKHGELLVRLGYALEQPVACYRFTNSAGSVLAFASMPKEDKR